MKKLNKKSAVTLLDVAAGPTYLMLFGVPALIVIGVIAIIVIAVILIKKARKKNQTGSVNNGEPKDKQPEE